jgi:ERCC4-type nuclease
VLLVDDRIGSKDLRGAFERQGLSVDLQRLDACDFAFVGRGIDNEPITIGIELKRLRADDDGRTDLLQSLRSGRLAGHQLGGMQEYDRAWLVTEGIWRANDQGVAEIWNRGGWTALAPGLLMGDIEAEILSVVTCGGLSYWHCPRSADTVRFVTRLYRWWTDKALNEHRSHQKIYIPPPDRALFVEPSPVTVMLFAGVKGLGYGKAAAVDEHFGGSFKRIVDASLPELRQVPGIGATLASRIHTVLHSASET